MLGSEERKNIEIQALKEAKEKEIKDIDDKIKDLKADLARLRP
jgi:ribosomal protein L29